MLHLCLHSFIRKRVPSQMMKMAMSSQDPSLINSVINLDNKYIRPCKLRRSTPSGTCSNLIFGDEISFYNYVHYSPCAHPTSFTLQALTMRCPYFCVITIIAIEMKTLGYLLSLFQHGKSGFLKEKKRVALLLAQDRFASSPHGNLCGDLESWALEIRSIQLLGSQRSGPPVWGSPIRRSLAHRNVHRLKRNPVGPAH
jgi:hypothetical protein